MNKINVVAEKLQLGKMLTAFLIGVLLAIGIAVMNVDNNIVLAANINPTKQIEDGVLANPSPSDYETTEREPGMNNHRDIEVRRMNTKRIDADAKALIEQSSRHLKDRTGNPAEAVSRVINTAPEGIKAAGRNIQEGTANGLDNLKESTDNIGDKVQQTANEVGHTIKSTFDQATNKS